MPSSSKLEVIVILNPFLAFDILKLIGPILHPVLQTAPFSTTLMIFEHSKFRKIIC